MGLESMNQSIQLMEVKDKIKYLDVKRIEF